MPTAPPTSPAPPRVAPTAPPRVVRLTPEQVVGYQSRLAAVERAQAALAQAQALLGSYTAGVLGGHRLARGTVVGLDPDARTLHVTPDA